MEHTLKFPSEKKSRFTIGFLDDNVNDDFHNQLMTGVLEAAKKYDVNIVRFGAFSPFIEYKSSLFNSMTLDHIEQYTLDGLMFLGWAKSGPSFNKDFVSRFRNIPILSIGSGFDHIPFLYFPGDIYVQELLVHLISVHGFKKIAYIEPLTMDGRNDAYINTMKVYGLFNPDLYVSQNDLQTTDSRYRGKKAVSLLIDERKVAFDAIISLFIIDTEVIMNDLKSRGISIPKDVAVVSYEAGEFGKYSSPGITTIEFPWMELGFKGCEKMVELLTTGSIPFTTMVPGIITYSSSCGCMSNSVKIIATEKLTPLDSKLENISELDIRILADKMSSMFPYTNIDFKVLLEAFIHEYKFRTEKLFLNALAKQLRQASGVANYSNVEDIICIFRKLLMPYIIMDEGLLYWSGDIFQQSQVMVREKVARIHVYEKAYDKIIYQTLLEKSRSLITEFSRKDLWETLRESLPKLSIQSCYVFIFNRTGTGSSLFENCSLEFEYHGKSNLNPDKKNFKTVEAFLQNMMADSHKTFTLFTHILHVAEQFIGFILFEPGPKGERVYQFLSSCLSTALSCSILLEKIDTTYKKLIQQAEREGMAEIATGILHNIGNILNSVNASVHMIQDLAGSSTFDDLFHANSLLGKNIDNLDDFICHDIKGRKLMQLYLKLGPPLEEIQQQILYHITRLSEKVNFINEIIISQQNYAGINTTLEELDVTNILEDVIMLHNSSIEKYHITVQKEFKISLRVRFQKIKLFHIFVNLINNAIDAMVDTPSDNRVLRFKIHKDASGKYVEISDSGCGIPENLIEKIFNDGYTTKKGTQGIGLNSSANYMSEMGGSIEAKSRGIGKGSTFVLRFK